MTIFLGEPKLEYSTSGKKKKKKGGCHSLG